MNKSLQLIADILAVTRAIDHAFLRETCTYARQLIKPESLRAVDVGTIYLEYAKRNGTACPVKDESCMYCTLAGLAAGGHLTAFLNMMPRVCTHDARALHPVLLPDLLLHAAFGGCEDICARVIENILPSHITDDGISRALCAAARAGHWRVCELIIREMGARDLNYESMMMAAMDGDCVEAFRMACVRFSRKHTVPYSEIALTAAKNGCRRIWFELYNSAPADARSSVLCSALLGAAMRGIESVRDVRKVMKRIHFMPDTQTIKEVLVWAKKNERVDVCRHICEWCADEKLDIQNVLREVGIAHFAHY